MIKAVKGYQRGRPEVSSRASLLCMTPAKTKLHTPCLLTISLPTHCACLSCAWNHVLCLTHINRATRFLMRRQESSALKKIQIWTHLQQAEPSRSSRLCSTQSRCAIAGHGGIVVLPRAVIWLLSPWASTEHESAMHHRVPLAHDSFLILPAAAEPSNPTEDAGIC